MTPVPTHVSDTDPGVMQNHMGASSPGKMGPMARIDTHHHAVPDFYRAWLKKHGVDAGGMPVPKWTPEASRRHMKLTGVNTAILSVTTPQVQAGSRMEAREMARRLNEHLHALVVADPGTFGYFATLPLPDAEGALDELLHCYARLAPDGVCLLANYGGVYLGDPVYEGLMAELDRRAAVVFVHPSSLPGPSVPGLPPFAADFLLDTTRAALNLARQGVLTRYPHVRFLLAHAGGFVPFAAGRLALAASPRNNPIEGLRLLRRFSFDTALSGTPWALPTLLRFAAKGHVTYGSDFPYAPAVASVASAGYQTIARARGGAAVAHLNAQKLFPRLVPIVPPIEVPSDPAESTKPGAPSIGPGTGPRPGEPGWELR